MKTIFELMSFAGVMGNSILWLYLWWTHIRESFVNLVNPFIQLAIFVELLTTPLFWVLTATAVVGHYAALGADRAQ